MEIEYIKHFNCLVPNGYNLRLGGNSGKHNEETKRKISESIKNGYKNGTITQEKGIISKRIKRNKKIVQFDLQGNKMKEFNDCTEAGKHIGYSRAHISRCLSGKSTSKKFIWKYEPIV